ncbi:MTH938/NDUFAF3 family protein [Catellatospora coxensis]
MLAAGATSVVLSLGQQLVLEVMPETEDYLAERGIDVHIAETREAVRVYNLLADAGVRVGALLHSTC